MDGQGSDRELKWSPTEPGRRVRLRDNPGRQGLTTGRTRPAGTFLLVEVDFGPNERTFRNYDVLEPVDETVDEADLLKAGRFGNPSDLRRVLTFEKIKGELTNIFYPMESSNTDFYPHQFKPVMSFIESPVGRLLIADEVGLGKTIEATYIWKEIQARHGARRLLVVCPAMLREKWRRDLKEHFNIRAEIVSARDLLARLTDIEQNRSEEAFVYIVSLESIRPPANFIEGGQNNARARLGRLLDSNAVSESFALLDYVVIDEAHYLRNPSTANNRIARLLRDASRHLVLLTATPIQIRSENLYQLLRVVDPDEFYDSQLFSQMLGANSHIVHAQRALWSQPPQLEEARQAIQVALSIDYFRNDAVLESLLPGLAGSDLSDAKRVETLRLLETRSLLSLHMSRSRKREVIERRVQRTPQALEVDFNEPEKSLYQHVTERIRRQAAGASGPSLFRLIMRQRQMASSLVGALESWNETGVIDELIWEDLGLSLDLDLDLDARASDEDDAKGDEGTAAFGAQFDIAALERADSKYAALRKMLAEKLTENAQEKFVVFAFFRGTLRYLRRRLREDGIESELLIGGADIDKDAVVARFGEESGPRVLLSSEVGSEGIDLQFCRFLVNYDLPWNPMKVEQRIGRLDRLGQRAERIAIVNLAVKDTIEDLILLRLYERINVFRESIGDLEEILGDTTEELILRLLDPNLTDEERAQQAEQTGLAIVNRGHEQERLEREAVNLVGFSDYILTSIKDSREKGRWLSGGELIAFVEDFFDLEFPGTTIEPENQEAARAICLSDEARRELAEFIEDRRPATSTRLHLSRRPVICLFDPRTVRRPSRELELIDPSHPLVQWIRERYQNDAGRLYRVSAVRLQSDAAGAAPGDYAYCVQRWSFPGLKAEHILAFSASPVELTQTLSDSDAEALVFSASRAGTALPNARNNIGDMRRVLEAVARCERDLESRWNERSTAFYAENEVRCQQQETSAQKYAERRIAELEERVARFRSRGMHKPVPMTEGLIRDQRDLLGKKLARISDYRVVDPEVWQTAIGFVRVE